MLTAAGIGTAISTIGAGIAALVEEFNNPACDSRVGTTHQIYKRDTNASDILLTQPVVELVE